METNSTNGELTAKPRRKHLWCRGGPKKLDTIADRVKKRNIKKRWNADPEIAAEIAEAKAEIEEAHREAEEAELRNQRNEILFNIAFAGVRDVDSDEGPDLELIAIQQKREQQAEANRRKRKRLGLPPIEPRQWSRPLTRTQRVAIRVDAELEAAAAAETQSKPAAKAQSKSKKSKS